MKDKTKETKWRKKFKKSVQALSELEELSITSNFIDLVCNNFDYFMGEATKSLLKDQQRDDDQINILMGWLDEYKDRIEELEDEVHY